MRDRAGSRRRLGALETTAAAFTLGYNAVLHRVLPDLTHVPGNLTAAGVVAVLARAAGAGLDDLGLAPRHAGSGLQVGLVAAGGVTAAVATAAALPTTRRHFADARVTGATPRRALYETVVRIPLGTALAEELLFRAALLGLFRRRHSTAVAVVGSSVLFGLWHVLPSIESLETHPAGEQVQERPIAAATAVAGVVVTTTAAGVGFAALRLVSRSVLAPVLAHAALNLATYGVTRLAGRRS